MSYYIPILPYPHLPSRVLPTFGYDFQTQLPYIMKMDRCWITNGTIDTVWGVEGIAHGNVIILPTALFDTEASALAQFQSIITVRLH